MLKILLLFSKLFLLFIVGLLTYEYLPTKIYRFPAEQPFAGTSFYNPYENAKPYWLKANFHAHAYAWGGLTNGHQTGDVVQAAYRKRGYDIPVVSDYFRLNPDVDKTDELYVPAYEHGTDIHKTHRHIIGTEKVDYYDITFSFNVHLKQYLVERMKKGTEVLAINHPAMRNGHPPEMLRKMSGYDCMEVYNKGRYYPVHWDAALSTGKAVWLLANDDCHDVEREGNTVGTAWTMVNVAEKKTAKVFEALKKGNTYAVQLRNDLPAEVHKSLRGKNENHPQEVKIRHDTLYIALKKKAEYIRLLGQEGAEKMKVLNTDSLVYPIAPNDTYLRTEIRNQYTNLLLNPIIRYDGKQIPSNPLQAKTHTAYTMLLRSGIVLFDILLLFLLFGRPFRNRKKKK